MTVFKDVPEEGEWFSFRSSRVDAATGEVVFLEPEEGAGRVRLRIPDKIFDAHREKNRVVEWVFNPRSRAMERVAYDKPLTAEMQEKFRRELYDYMITGLEGFYFGDTEVPNNSQGKYALMRVPAFDRFISECLRVMGEADPVKN